MVTWSDVLTLFLVVIAAVGLGLEIARLRKE